MYEDFIKAIDKVFRMEEEEDFDIKHTIDTHGKIGIENTNTNKKE
mgnify:CR=1 FL=1